MHKASADAADYLRAKPFCGESNDSPFSFKWVLGFLHFLTDTLADGGFHFTSITINTRRKGLDSQKQWKEFKDASPK